MFTTEKLQGNDRLHKLSAESIKRMKKERIDKKRKRLEIADSISDEQIAEKESEITKAQEQAIQETESEMVSAEGNIAEQLLAAGESGADGDISAALGKAQQYHSKSKSYAKTKLEELKKKYVQKLFA